MKHKYLLLGACVVLCGCTSVSTALKQGEELANNLETEKDVILTLDKYTIYQNRCVNYKSALKGVSDGKTWGPVNYIGVSILFAPISIPAFTIYYMSTGNFYPYLNEREICYSNDGFAEQNIDFACLQEWRQGEEYYNSDDCIVFRRNIHESRVGYFDYKRFLPDNTIVKTDDDFLALRKYYLKTSECDNLKQVTTSEKQECKDVIRANTIKMATTGISCMDSYKDEYKEKLNELGEWYEWAIDHDPYGNQKYLRAIGEYTAAYFMPVQYVYSEQEALKEIKSKIQQFSKEHFCKIDGWKTEIRKLGYKL